MRKTTRQMLALGLSLGLATTLAAQSVHAEGELYTDIAASYAQEAILSLHAKGIVNGKGNGLFGPRDFMTREQFAKLLVLTKNFTPDTSVDTAFADNMDANQWYFGYVQAAQKHGLMIGMGNGRFGVGDTLTREQAVTAIVRAAGLESEVDPNAVPTFADTEQISHWAWGYVALAQQKGLVLGMEGNTFQGSVTTTREMAVQMLYRYLKAPAPETPAPETPAPEAPAPEAPAPETPAPEAPAPETPAPETPAPETPAPETPAPETPAPETPAPETPAPESGDTDVTPAPEPAPAPGASDVAPPADDANGGSTDDSTGSDQAQDGTPVPPADTLPDA